MLSRGTGWLLLRGDLSSHRGVSKGRGGGGLLQTELCPPIHTLECMNGTRRRGLWQVLRSDEAMVGTQDGSRAIKRGRGQSCSAARGHRARQGVRTRRGLCRPRFNSQPLNLRNKHCCLTQGGIC